MSIIKKQKKDPAALKQRATENIDTVVSASAVKTLQTLITAQRDGMSALWKHQILTPQEAADACSNVLEVFARHAELTTFVIGMAGKLGVSVNGRAIGTQVVYPLHQAAVASDEREVVVEVLLPSHNFTVSGDRIIISEDVYTPTT